MTEYAAGNAAVIVTPALPNFHKIVAREMGGLGPIAEKAGTEAGQKTGAGYTSALQKVIGGGKRVAGVIDKAMTAAGAAGAAALATQFGNALNLDAARGKLQAQLGLTSKESARVGTVAGKLYAQAYGSSMDEVQGAITSVIRNMDGLRGASSKTLQDTTARAITLGQVMDADVGDVTRTVSQLMRTGLAKNSKAAFDLLTRGAQLGGDKAQDLLDTMNEYPTQFRKLGLSGSKAMGLIVQGLRAGARDSDLVADALKEFSIRAVDGSKTTAQGFKMLGLSGKTMAERIGKGGKSASDALDLTLQRLRGIKDPVKQSQAAVALFGTQSEDLGKALFALDPSKATDSMGKLGGATDKAGQAMSDTAQSKFTEFKRGLQTSVVQAIVNDVIPAAKRLGDTLNGLNISPDAATKAGLGVGAAVVGWKSLSLAANGTKAAIGGVKTVGKGAGKAVELAKGIPGGWETLRLRSMYAGDAVKSAGSKVAGAAQAAGRGVAAVGRFAGSLAAAGGRAALTGLTKAGGAIGSVAASAWRGVTALGALAASYARAAAAAVLNAARTVAMTVVQNAVRVATMAWTAVQWLLNAALNANPIGLIIIGITALVAAVIYAYTHFSWFRAGVQAVWSGIQAAGLAAWNFGIKPIFEGIKFFIMNILVPYYKFWWSVAKVVWSGIAKAGQVGWAILKIIFSGIKAGLSAVGVVFRFFLSVARTVFSTVGRVIMAVWRGDIAGAFSALKSGVGAVRSSFSTAVSAITKIWGGLKSATRKPVEFIVNTVYNNGIRSVWNKVAGLVHLPELPAVKFARGGINEILPGYTPGRDPHQFYSPTGGRIDMSGGEAIMRPEFTRAVGGNFVRDANRIARKRGASGVRDYLANGTLKFARGGVYAGGPVQRFAGGGILDAIKHAGSLVIHGASSLLDEGASSFARKALKPILNKIPGADSTWAKAMYSMPPRMVDGFVSWLKSTVDPKLGGDAYGVVAQAKRFVGVGDDRGPNNNMWTRAWGMPGAPWCAMFVSDMIKRAGATRHYPGYPTAAVAGYNGAMRHVPTGSGQAGDLGVYGGGAHINIIAGKKGGAYDTYGGNQNAVVQHKVRGGQTSVLRPRFSKGGILGRQAAQVFKREAPHNADPHELQTPLVRLMRALPAGQMGHVARTLVRQGLAVQNAGVYDDGGVVPPGLSLVANASRRPEALLSNAQWAAISRARGGDGDTYETTYHLYQRDMSIGDLEALQRRQEARQRVGRPH